MALVLGDRHLGWLAGEKTRDTLDVTALVALHAGLLYRVAFSVVRMPAEAEDIVQETFARAWEQREKLAAWAEPRAWLVRVAWNLALDRKRRFTPASWDEHVEESIASAELPADRQLIASAELQRVLAVLESLPAKERAVLLLGAVEELSVAEIAQTLGRSESSVRSLTFRARAHLEERLRQQQMSRQHKRRSR